MTDDALLARLASTGSAAVPLDDLPSLLGLDDQAVANVMAAWVNAGDVELWPDHPDGPACVLSSIAAERLGFILDPDAPLDLGSRWIRRGSLGPDRLETERHGKHRRNVIRESELFDAARHPSAGLDLLTDRRAIPPPLAAERHDVGDKEARAYFRSYGDPQYPTILIGLDLPWPVAPLPDGSCGACGSRGKLWRSMVCLVCLRAGCDYFLPHAPKPDLSKVYTPDEKLAGGVGKLPPPPRPRPKPVKPRKRKPVANRPTTAFDLKALRVSLEGTEGRASP
jgi:hypothetical protein